MSISHLNNLSPHPLNTEISTPTSGHSLNLIKRIINYVCRLIGLQDYFTTPKPVIVIEQVIELTEAQKKSMFLDQLDSLPETIETNPYANLKVVTGLAIGLLTTAAIFCA